MNPFTGCSCRTSACLLPRSPPQPQLRVIRCMGVTCRAIALWPCAIPASPYPSSTLLLYSMSAAGLPPLAWLGIFLTSGMYSAYLSLTWTSTNWLLFISQASLEMSLPPRSLPDSQSLNRMVPKHSYYNSNRIWSPFSPTGLFPLPCRGKGSEWHTADVKWIPNEWMQNEEWMTVALLLFTLLSFQPYNRKVQGSVRFPLPQITSSLRTVKLVFPGSTGLHLIECRNVGEVNIHLQLLMVRNGKESNRDCQEA